MARFSMFLAMASFAVIIIAKIRDKFVRAERALPKPVGSAQPDLQEPRLLLQNGESHSVFR